MTATLSGTLLSPEEDANRQQVPSNWAVRNRAHLPNHVQLGLHATHCARWVPLPVVRQFGLPPQDVTGLNRGQAISPARPEPRHALVLAALLRPSPPRTRGKVAVLLAAASHKSALPRR